MAFFIKNEVQAAKKLLFRPEKRVGDTLGVAGAWRW
jgi:hypothetical protein